jgi:hypothetical protein
MPDQAWSGIGSRRQPARRPAQADPGASRSSNLRATTDGCWVLALQHPGEQNCAQT